MERRKAMLAVLIGKENGGILLCESGGPRRTVSSDIDRVAEALGYRGNFISKQLQHDFHLSDDYRRVITASILEYQPPVHGKRPLINDTNAALLVTLHTQRSKIAPVSRRAAIREFRNIVHATGEEMAKIATTEKEKAEDRCSSTPKLTAELFGKLRPVAGHYYSPAEIQLFEGGFGVLQSKISRRFRIIRSRGRGWRRT